MSETVNEIERRLAPERLKDEAKATVHETIDEVRHRFNPQRMANRTGQSIMDSIKDHPIPAAIAGISIGYLLMKAGEGAARRERDEDYRHRRLPYGRDYYPERYYDEADYYSSPYRRGYREDAYYEGGSSERWSESYAETYQGGESDETSVRDRAAEQAGAAKDRASDLAGQARHQAHEASRQVRHGARRAQSGLEEFVYDNPLAAGALAVGVGALLGSLLPSTEVENEWMGSARDEVAHRAKDAAQETVERGKEVAGRVASEAKEATKHMKRAAQDPEHADEHMERAGGMIQDVASTAREGAQDVKDEARWQAEKKTS